MGEMGSWPKLSPFVPLLFVPSEVAACSLLDSRWNRLSVSASSKAIRLSLKTVCHCQASNACSLLSVSSRIEKASASCSPQGQKAAGALLLECLSQVLWCLPSFSRKFTKWPFLAGKFPEGWTGQLACSSYLLFCRALHCRMQGRASLVKGLWRLVWPRLVPPRLAAGERHTGPHCQAD